MGFGRVVAAALLGLLVLGLCGCGPGSRAAPDPPPSASPPGPAPSATPPPVRPSASPSTNAQGNGVMVPPLPDLSRFPAREPHPPGPASRIGADVSWPQCPKGTGIAHKRGEGRPMPTPAARFVVLGLTNGPSFVPNPCLADQVRWVRARHLLAAAYAVVSYPDAHTLDELGDDGPYDGGTRTGALANTGYRAALFDVATMHRTGLRTPVVWVDVEHVPYVPWSPDTRANAAVVRGAVSGFRDAGFEVGVYSTLSLWRDIVGDLRLGLPAWRPAGHTSMREALRRCRDDWSFQGGHGVLAQWVDATGDRDIVCPGAGRDPSRWFHRY
ncbi:MAG: hypothetical protein ACRDPH_08945 [Marmoricola sp.]